MMFDFHINFQNSLIIRCTPENVKRTEKKNMSFYAINNCMRRKVENTEAISNEINL